MDIFLTPEPPEFERAVKKKVASGLYHSANEVICAALQMALLLEQETGWLKREAKIGYAQFEARHVTQVNSKAEFFALIRA